MRVLIYFGDLHPSSELVYTQCIVVTTCFVATMQAMAKYLAAIEHFIRALKTETNAARKATIQARVAGYMRRAETLKKKGFTASQIDHRTGWEPHIAASRESVLLLQQLEDVVRKGIRTRVLQATPHLVLLRKSFYHEHMAPVLTKWLILWIQSIVSIPLPYPTFIEYLSRGVPSAPEVTKRLDDR